MTHWLDKAIAQQAAYYGLTVEQYQHKMESLCDLQAQADFSQWEATKEQ